MTEEKNKDAVSRALQSIMPTPKKMIKELLKQEVIASISLSALITHLKSTNPSLANEFENNLTIGQLADLFPKEKLKEKITISGKKELIELQAAVLDFLEKNPHDENDPLGWTKTKLKNATIREHKINATDFKALWQNVTFDVQPLENDSRIDHMGKNARERRYFHKKHRPLIAIAWRAREEGRDISSSDISNRLKPNDDLEDEIDEELENMEEEEELDIPDSDELDELE